MLIPSTQSNTVEQILRNADGRMVRATFYVYQIHGRTKARLVSVVFLDEVPSLSCSSFVLSGFVPTAQVGTSKPLALQATPSPYFNSNVLYSLGTKPRAPTLVL